LRERLHIADEKPERGEARIMSRGKKAGNIVVWIIVGLLIVGLGGFGVSNFGGTISSIGKVGDTEIDVQTYALSLQNELDTAERQFGMNLSLPQAQAFGLVDRARSRVILTAALDNETTRLGMSLGDEQVREQILATPAFTGLDGSFDRESYRFTLERSGLTEGEYEARIRQDAARALLQGSVLAGVKAPASYSETLVNYFAARRSYSMITLTAADLVVPAGTPDEAALQAYYEANPDDFTLPATRQITYAWLTPAMVLDTVTVDEQSLRDAYEDRQSIYQTPERRLVERLVYPDEATAQAARDRLDAGEATFQQLVEERGLSLSDIDIGDVTERSLGAAGAEVFALSEPGVVGPLASDLGPALFRMNAVLEARNTTFEEAQLDLRAELAQDAAIRAVDDMIGDLDDQLAAGATLEELARETELELGYIDYFAGQDEGIAGYEAFRAAAAAAQEGDFPELAQLNDGGVFALRVDGETPAALQPLDDVRDQAVAGWQAQETMRLLTQLAETKRDLLARGAVIQAVGGAVETGQALTRRAVSPPAISETLFALALNEVAVVPVEDTVIVVHVTDILGPDDTDPEIDALRGQLDAEVGNSIAEDMLNQFTQGLLDEAGLELDQAAINAVHAQIVQ